MTQLDAIFGRPGETAVDPVCKMTVQRANAPGGSAEHDGETYFFCSPGCREAFVASPATYLASDQPDHGHMHHH